MTDRTLRSSADLDGLRFDARGLVPVVAQSASDGTVLMVAWADREALELTLATGHMHYWSRSRERIWKKGETSGNVQELASLHADCDADTVLARVRMDGPACHTDERTCFGAGTAFGTGTTGDREPGAGVGPDGASSASEADTVISDLWQVLEDRARTRPEGSYTTRLLADENLRLKKLGEEAVELVTALLRKDGRAPEEAADLVYHLLVALLAAGHSWDDVRSELARRRG